MLIFLRHNSRPRCFARRRRAADDLADNDYGFAACRRMYRHDRHKIRAFGVIHTIDRDIGVYSDARILFHR